MKKLVLLLIVALVLVGVVATALPTLAAWSNPPQPAPPVYSIDDTVPATCVACFPSPCDCLPDC